MGPGGPPGPRHAHLLARLIRAAREINDAKPQWVIDKVREAEAPADEHGEEAPNVLPN